MDNFKEFLTSNVGNSDVIEWWMLLVAIIAVVIVLCVIIGVVWTRADKKNKMTKASAEAIANSATTVEPVISVSPSEQSVEPKLPDTIDVKNIQEDDGVIKLQSIESDNTCAAAESDDNNDAEEVVAALVPQENAAVVQTTQTNIHELKESEDDMGIFNKKNKETEPQKKANLTAQSTDKKPIANNIEKTTAANNNAPAAKKNTETAPVKAPIAKKLAPINKTTTTEEPKKAKVIVGTEALPKSVKKNIKLNEIKSAVVVNTGETFGKYFIVKDERNTVKPFKFELRANNGQLLFESEPYKVKPRENSIEAFKKHVNTGEFVVDEDKFGFFRFKLYTDAGKLLGVGESYKTRQSCESSIESVKRFSLSATVVEDTTIDKNNVAE